jgi:hypothetical protein
MAVAYLISIVRSIQENSPHGRDESAIRYRPADDFTVIRTNGRGPVSARLGTCSPRNSSNRTIERSTAS